MASRILTEPFVAGEDRDVPFDFKAQMPVGVTISSAVATAVVYSGTDAVVSIAGTPAISGSIVSIPVSGVDVGVIYELSVAATLSDGQIPVISTLIAGVPNA